MSAVRIGDCWNRIGVRGDNSCPELKTYIHCRNCPVYGSAASDLLDRAMPPGYVAEWTRHFARPQEIEASDTQSAVIFRIGPEWLALRTQVFEEVAEQRTIHSLPEHRRGIVLGLVNVRGELLICVSVAKMLGLEAVAAAHARDHQIVHPRLLVIRHEGGRSVFPVDEVHGIQRYHERALQEAPSVVAKGTTTYTRAVLPWRDKSVGVLDDQLLCHVLNRSLSSATPI